MNDLSNIGTCIDDSLFVLTNSIVSGSFDENITNTFYSLITFNNLEFEFEILENYKNVTGLYFENNIYPMTSV